MILLLAAFFIIRIISLVISIQNSKALEKKGAIAYGKMNSKLLALTHILIYMCAAIESYIKQPEWTIVNSIGLSLMAFAYMILFIVIKTLGPIWTLKLYILPDHPIIKSGLYKITKHPNYYLNIIPELIGVLLMTSSFITSLLLIPYAYFLYSRIKQEEAIMNL